MIRDLTTKKVTIFPGVPTMFTALINHPGVDKLDLSSLKYCGSGGAPLPLEVAQRFHKLTGCNLSEGWGMTETSPTGTFTPVNGHAQGRLLRHADARHRHPDARTSTTRPDMCRSASAASCASAAAT